MDDYARLARPYGTWVFKSHRRIHRAMRLLPRLESDLATTVEEMSRGAFELPDTRLEKEILLANIALIRAEIRTAFRSLSDLRLGIERSGISDRDFEERLTRIYGIRPGGDAVLNQIRAVGGMRAFLKRLSLFLLKRYEGYTECLKQVKDYDSRSSHRLTALANELWTCLPGGPGTPDVQYKFLCLGGPLAWAVTAALIGAVLVLDDDQADDDDPPDDDGDDEGEDPDGGICYPEGGLDVDAGVCTPSSPA